MAYMTPELLLVGAAQHLVLGPQADVSIINGCEYDSQNRDLSDLAELW